MKKIFIVLALISIIFSANARPVDEKLAREIGVKFLNANTTMKASVNDLQLAKTYSTDAKSAAFYIFNTSNGFVIVSADDHAYPILGYSDEGQFNVENIPPAVEEYFNDFTEQISKAAADDYYSEEVTAEWQLVQKSGQVIETKSGEKGVSALMSTKWDQGCRYNDMCPDDWGAILTCFNCPTGCVPLAMGQIMRYWRHPRHGSGSHSYKPSGYPTQSANFGNTTYKWSDMPNALYIPYDPDEKDAIDRLLWHIGVSVDAIYGEDETGAYSRDVPNSLKNYWRYSEDCHIVYKRSYSNPEWISMLKGELNASRPVYYSGGGNDGRHAFVCDGYNNSDQFHFNWGWGGDCNGYYKIGALNPDGDHYNIDNDAVIGIHPKSHTISVSANNTNGGTVSGGGDKYESSSCCVKATPKSGYVFVNWTENGTVVSTNASYTFDVECSRTLVANFRASNIHTDSNTFYDSGGANGNYFNSENWTATYYPATTGKAIKVTFTSFTLENNYDKLYVYDGPSTSSMLIGTYTGTTSPGTITATNISGALTFKFTSDSSVTKAGWVANINAVDIKTDNGYFYDSGGPNANYSSNENYTITYYPATTGKAVKATFTSFTLENNYDKLYVYNGTSTSSPLIGTYTGTTSPGTITATNIAGALTFKFTSNSSVNKAGWAAGISVVDNVVHTNSGYFYDSGGANGDYVCSETSVITYYPSTSDKAVRFTFNSFTLENNWDKLYVYNGTSTSTQLIGTYTGTTSPGTITASNPAGALTFKFTSDSSVTKAGWAASISTVNNASSFIVRADNDNFYDTGGPNTNYSNSENYTVTYYPATTGKAVKAAFSSFTLENSYDKLYVYDGTSTSATLIGTYTGTSSPGTITATNIAGALTFKFTSDGSVNKAGWAAGISVVDNVIRTNSGYFYDSGGANGDYVCSETSVITYYPSTSGKAVRFTFNSFNVENSYDKLYVYNGTSTSASLIGTYTGTSNPGTITANNSSGALTFKFTSDGSVVRAGWKATITVVNKSKGEEDYIEQEINPDNEMATDIEVKIYPNPVHDMMTVEAEGMEQVVIFNMQGQLVYSQEVNDDHVSVNMSDFASGMYIVRIATKEGMQSKQIIVE